MIPSEPTARPITDGRQLACQNQVLLMESGLRILNEENAWCVYIFMPRGQEETCHGPCAFRSVLKSVLKSAKAFRSQTVNESPERGIADGKPAGGR
jgi:hypothetical protein